MADDGYVSWYQTKLWQLLPAVYRAQDATVAGVPGPLQEFCNRLGAQSAVLRRSIDRIWDNQSIETCDDWVIPYIGELLSTRLVSYLRRARAAARCRQDDLLSATRRHARPVRGTRADIAGRDARAVEFFRRLGRTRHGSIADRQRFRPRRGTVGARQDLRAGRDRRQRRQRLCLRCRRHLGVERRPHRRRHQHRRRRRDLEFRKSAWLARAGGDRGAGRGEFAHPGRRLRRSAQCLRRGQYRRRVPRVRPYRRPARRRPVLRLVQYFASRHVHLVAAHLSDLGCDAGGGAAAVGPGVALLHVRPQLAAVRELGANSGICRPLGSNV